MARTRTRCCRAFCDGNNSPTKISVSLKDFQDEANIELVPSGAIEEGKTSANCNRHRRHLHGLRLLRRIQVEGLEGILHTRRPWQRGGGSRSRAIERQYYIRPPWNHSGNKCPVGAQRRACRLCNYGGL